jgi:hypothetical protein
MQDGPKIIKLHVLIEAEVQVYVDQAGDERAAFDILQTKLTESRVDLRCKSGEFGALVQEVTVV